MESSSTFLGLWDQSMLMVALAFVAIGLGTLLYHEFKIVQIKDLKDRYDYVNRYEIRYFWFAITAFISAIAVFANTIATDKILVDGMRWFFVRLFITAGFGVIAYITCSSLIRIYYPRQLERRLSRLRNTPRLSPEGNLMRKVADGEEEHHLEKSQRQEMHTIDYDVWVDDATGFKKIEKYPAYQHAEECSECGFFTMRIDTEEIEHAPTAHEQGTLMNHYMCSYCGHREKREITVAKLSTNAV